MIFLLEAQIEMQRSTYFNLKDVFLHGPKALPRVLRRKSRILTIIKSQNHSEPEVSSISNNLLNEVSNSLVSFFLKPVGNQANRKVTIEDYEEYEDYPFLDELDEEDIEEEIQRRRLAHLFGILNPDFQALRRPLPRPFRTL